VHQRRVDHRHLHSAGRIACQHYDQGTRVNLFPGTDFQDWHFEDHSVSD
jgi:hypothetical protein